jgi:ABC-type cobalamin/Fe3+-siderophores transport system ATPase subunit
MLKIENLSVSYGSRKVLERISLEITPGSVVGLIGPNGAGKSTLIRTVSGVLPLQQGRILVGGQDLARLSYAQRARLVAVVPQARNLPGGFTAWETVLLGRTPHLNWLGQLSPQDEERARQAMQRTDSIQLADRPVGELSGGEQQRVLLARALAQASPILLLDEPTAHLDLQYQVCLLDLVRDLARREKLAILIAIHDLNLVARYTDRVALLVGGQLQALGSAAEVLDPVLLSRAYRVPLQSIPTDKLSYPLIIPAGD